MKHGNRPLVSICIPTYNRATYLEKTLKSYIKTKEFINGVIEIVISDNASSDNTGVIGKKYSNKYSNIFYYKNNNNIKDKNFPLVLSKGHGILHKLMHDNFIISQNGLTEICSIARMYQIDKPVIFFDNGSAVNIKSKVAVFYDLETFLLGLSYWITWSGGVALWHDECISLENDIDCCDLHLWQVRKICDLVDSKKIGIVIHRNYGSIYEVDNKDVSYGIVDVFYYNYFKILNRFYEKSIIRKSCIDFLEKDLLYRYFTKLIFYADCGLDKNMNYGNQYSLKTAVYSIYQRKKYFSSYLNFYKLLYILSYLIKKINMITDIKNMISVVKNIDIFKRFFMKIIGG